MAAKLARARAGDENAFRQLTEPYRRELQLHCYRILGSVQDAEDMVQETLLAAWRSLEAFEGRRVRALLAVPDRHQPLPQRAARPIAPPQAGTGHG
jgi:DNA-directed RNA polymerase specialized sigma24 family protein